MIMKVIISSAKRGVDFRSGWALCLRYRKHLLLLSLRFRTDKTIAVASLSHRAKLPGGVRWAPRSRPISTPIN